MIDQKTFDAVADHLVAIGVRVAYVHLREEFLERSRAANGAEHGSSHSLRDIQDPFDDWKRRRRYKPHLAHHDLSDEAEKAVAASVDALRRAADRLPRDMPSMVPPTDCADVTGQIERLAKQLEKRLDAISSECTALRQGIAAIAAAGPPRGTRVIRKGRKSGVFDSTSRHFWNQLMLVFQNHIKTHGPKPIGDLLALVDQDSHDLAAAAFEPIEETMLREKLAVRVGRNNYFRLEDGLYHLLPPEPRRRGSSTATPSKRKPRAKR